tara:strand:- start:137 stop:382 length:246 start_codon:yes stop_codon:yes gene_type:complete
MPSHKESNAFIKKYNKEFSIKGYSKMNITEKNKAIENKLRKLNSENTTRIREDWIKLKLPSAKSMGRVKQQIAKIEKKNKK